MAIRVRRADYAQAKAEEVVRGGVESVSIVHMTQLAVVSMKNGYAIVSGWGEVRANAYYLIYMNGYMTRLFY